MTSPPSVRDSLCHINYIQTTKEIYQNNLFCFFYPLQNNPLFNSTTQLQRLTTLYKNPFENTVEKEKNAGNQQFLIFPQYFLPFPKQISISESHLFCCLQILSIWTGLKFCHLVKSKSFNT